MVGAAFRSSGFAGHRPCDPEMPCPCETWSQAQPFARHCGVGEQGVRIVAQPCVPDRQIHLSEPHFPRLQNVFLARCTHRGSGPEVQGECDVYEAPCPAQPE